MTNNFGLILQTSWMVAEMEKKFRHLCPKIMLYFYVLKKLFHRLP